MNNEKKTWAPYNFVPFSNKILLPYADGVESLPGHDEINPFLKTGEIHVTLTAETPVCVSDGDKGSASFFCGANGEMMIPGSTVRGLLRENMQILGFGLICPGEDLEDRRIYFREIAAKNNTLRSELKTDYQNFLKIQSEVKRPGGNSYVIGKSDLKAGFLRKEGDEYYIYPTDGKKLGNYEKISRQHPDIKRSLARYKENPLQNVFPVYFCVEGESNGRKSNGRKKTTRIYDNQSSIPDQEKRKSKAGRLLIRPNNVFLFPEPVRRRSDAVRLSEADILSYQTDAEYRREFVNADGDSESDDFWILPEDGEEKPVFYVEQGRKRTYFGMSLYRTSALKVQPGYICNDGETYRIYHTMGNEYFRIQPDHPALQRFKITASDGKVDDKEHYGRTVKVEYSGRDSSLKLYKPGESHSEITQEGVLLYTGKPVSKANHVYLFPKINMDGECVKEMKHDDPDLLSYKADFEERENALKAYHNADLWKLPENKEPKPVFYAKVDGHIYFGMSLFLRIGYKHTFSEGLPAYHRELSRKIEALRKQECQQEADSGEYQKQREEKKREIPLDFPHGILGFSYGDIAYRSRVFVEDFLVTQGGESVETISYIPGGPKPSFYPAYLRDAPEKAYDLPKVDITYRTYNHDDFLLRGYKQYWMRECAVEPSAPENANKETKSELSLLPKGTVFTGTIRYKNLTEQELGLLLWSLRLEESCFQSIGKGKPYGYGRMKLEIKNLLEVVPESLYSTLEGTPFLKVEQDVAKRVDRYIHTYDKAAEAMLEKLESDKDIIVSHAKSIKERPEIQDFFYMKRKLDQKEGTAQETDRNAKSAGSNPYMDVNMKDYSNLTTPLPSVRELRQETAPDIPLQDEGELMENLLKRLEEQANRNRLGHTTAI